MVICPKCGRPVSGRARACGYCGESLVQDYFQNSGEIGAGGHASGGDAARDSGQVPAGAVAAATLSVIGALLLLAALVFQLLPLFRSGGELPELGLGWWLRTIPLTLLPVVLLMQQLLLRGRRESIVSDCVWLFLSAFGLTFVLQAFLERGTEGAFYGVPPLPYLLAAGCTLVAVAGIAGILSFQKER